MDIPRLVFKVEIQNLLKPLKLQCKQLFLQKPLPIDNPVTFCILVRNFATKSVCVCSIRTNNFVTARSQI